MVVAEVMTKPSVQVTVSDSSTEESEESVDELEAENDSVDTAAENASSNDEDENASSNDEAENASSNDEENSGNELLVTNEGWADSVAKILGSSKPKNKKTLVLSRAKKHSDIVKKEADQKPAFEVIGDQGDVKTELKKELVKKEDDPEPPVKKTKHEKPSIRVKPNILEKDRERLLNKIATKGVVQLFNAVRNQQKTLEKETGRSDLSEAKKEKILKKFDKRSFLDTLMGPTKSVVVDEVKPLKDEVKAEEKPRWNALRDDFMMGAKMKDWDKESVDE